MSKVLALLILVGGTLCGIGWAMSSPVSSSPDDTYHLPSIWCAAGNDDPKNCTEFGIDANNNRVGEVPPLIASGLCWVPDTSVSGDCQRKVGAKYQVTALLNNGDYPPGYYRTMNFFIIDSVPKSVVLMRTVNVMLAAVIFGLIILAGTPAVGRALVYAVSIALVPLGWFIVASTNPSSWAVTGLTGYGFAVHGLFSAPTRRRRAVLAGVALVSFMMAVNARGDAAAYVGLISIAVAILHVRELKARWRLLIVPAIACAVSLGFLVTSAQVANIAGAAAESENTASQVIIYNTLEWPNLISGLFGYGFGLGWLDTPVHPITAFTMSCLFGFLFFHGLRRLNVTKAAAVLTIVVPMMVLPLLTLYRTRLFVGSGVQPRYLLPLIPIALGLLQTGLRPNRTLRLSRAQGVVIWIALAMANASALYVNMRRYVTGLDGPMIIEKAEWWWGFGLSPNQTALMGAVGFMLFTLPLVLMSGTPRQPKPEPVHQADDEPAPLVRSTGEEPA